MNIKQNLFIAVACCILVSFANGSRLIDPDSGLLSFMSRSNELLSQNPARSLECFNYYIPLINKLAEQYESNYKGCLNSSELERANADNATLGQRNDLASAAKGSCDLLTQCDQSDSVSGIFQCYIDGGSANMNTMYIINANASEQLVNLREQYHLIETREFKCTNDTKRAYEKEPAEAYASLNNCILGISEIPTEGPSPTNIPSTSDAPSTTATPSSTTPSATEVEPSKETEDPSSPTTAEAEEPNN